jgi:exonuclease-1
MGVQGLLKLLSPISNERHLSELRGLRVAVDGYVWLHRGIFFNAAEIAKGHASSAHVSYFLNRAKQLLR